MNRDNTDDSEVKGTAMGQGKGSINDRVIRIEEPQSIQSQASAWLAKLDTDEPSEENLKAFKLWVNEDEAHIKAFEKAAAIWGDLNILSRIPLVLQQKELQKQTAQRERENHRVSSFAVAAAIILGIFVALQVDLNPQQPTLYWTAVGEKKTIVLEDGSVVQLNTNSRLGVDYNEKHRAIYLHQGEAHFDVEHNPKIPFEVYAGTGRVRAVGTAFSVMLNNRDVEVIVTEGVVDIVPEVSLTQTDDYAIGITGSASTPSAAAQSPQNEAPQPRGGEYSAAGIRRVWAGNEVIFNQDQFKLVQLVEDKELDRKLAWQKGLLIFNGESLEEVIAEISRYTDTKILIKSDKARKIRIGGQFQAGDTKAIFNALEKGFNLKVDYVTHSLVYLSYKN